MGDPAREGGNNLGRSRQGPEPWGAGGAACGLALVRDEAGGCNKGWSMGAGNDIEEGLSPGGTRELWRASSRTAKQLGLLPPPRHRPPPPAPLQNGTGPIEAPCAACPHPGRGTGTAFHLIILLHAFEK